MNARICPCAPESELRMVFLLLLQLAGLLQIGCSHSELEEFEAAEAAFGKAHEYSVRLHKDLQQPGTPEDLLKEFTDDFCLLLIHRAKNAWQLQQKVCDAL